MRTRWLCAALLAVLCVWGAKAAPPTVVTLSLTDPHPHRAEAEAGRFLDEPRYDIPPIGFNEHSFFTDALINFDAIRDWTAELQDCRGYFCLSEDQPIRGKPNAKVEVELTGKKPTIVLTPPQPIRIAQRFDTLEMWFYGHKIGASLGVVFRKSDGTVYRWKGGNDRSDPPGWTTFWNLLRVRLPAVIEAGAELTAIEIYPRPWRQTVQSLVPPPEGDGGLFHLDQFRVSLLDDLMKQPAPDFPNKGPIVRIPTDENGTCPRTTEPVSARVRMEGKSSLLTYTTPRGEEVTYVYTPTTGALTDLTVVAKGKLPFRPAVDSGPVFDFAGAECSVVGKGGASARLLAHVVEGDRVIAEWEYAGHGLSQTIRYEFSLKGKTLQVQLSSRETHFCEWKFGYADGLKEYKVIEVPFMIVYSPRLLVTDGLFVTYYMDWYKSNVSTLPNSRPNRPLPDGAAQYSFNDPEYDKRPGKYAYLPRTDGSRHPLKECFYITVSSNVDDVWLSIANPPSPMKDVIKERLYRMTSPRGAQFIAQTHALLDLFDKYDMTKLYWLYHARLWRKRRMGSEPFFGADTVSVVHEAAGGDAAVIKVFQRMRDLGIRPGYYDGYETMMTTHKWFRPDWCKYDSDGNWQMRHGPVMKPWAFPEYAATVYRDRAKKYGAQVLYQDGWTSLNPGAWNDYDARYPESGKLIDTLRALATGWQRCREICDGPVFSEGRGGDYYTAGLNEGDYSKLDGDTNELPADKDRTELLVDFRLKKISPLCPTLSINIGYIRWAKPWSVSQSAWDDWSLYHQFMATQIACGAIGMLEPYDLLYEDPHKNFEQMLRGYYLLQQLQTRYIMEPVEEIRYFDGEKLVSTSEAILRDVYKDNRLCVRFANGLVVYVNVNWDGKHWIVTDRGQEYTLPPGGWLARQGGDFFEFAGMVNGKRVDFVDSPAYVYLDGHGAPVTIQGHTATRQYVKIKTGRKAGSELRYPEK